MSADLHTNISSLATYQTLSCVYFTTTCGVVLSLYQTHTFLPTSHMSYSSEEVDLFDILLSCSWTCRISSIIIFAINYCVESVAASFSSFPFSYTHTHTFTRSLSLSLSVYLKSICMIKTYHIHIKSSHTY